MVVAKACKDERTYQKGNRSELAKSSQMNKSISLSKTKFQLLGSNVRKKLVVKEHLLVPPSERTWPVDPDHLFNKCVHPCRPSQQPLAHRSQSIQPTDSVQHQS